MSLIWLVVAAVTLFAGSGHDPHPRRALPAFALVVLFAATQAFVINIQLRREARSVFISEIPTFLAVLSLAPLAFVGVRVAGAFLAFGAIRRQYHQPLKLLFNLALATAEPGIAILTYDAIARHVSGMPGSWVAAAAAACAASAFTAAGVGLVIELVEGTLNPLALLRSAGVATLEAVPVTAVAATIWAAWDDDVWSAVPLVLVTALLLVAYRAYASLQERHLALERLYRFSQVVSSAPGVEDVLAKVLQQAREIMHAEQARLTVLRGPDPNSGVEVVLSGVDTLTRGEPFYLRSGDPAIPALLEQELPVHVERLVRTGPAREWLDRCRLRDSIMVPLRGDTGPIAVLAVDDRLGDARGFVAADVKVLETVANQAAIALRNGELLDQLRHESLHDPLTGLPNRVLFQREIEAELAASGGGFAVGILDLDAFKDVNDTLGHQDGDRLLQEIANRMRSGFDGHGIVARLGGDEFAVLMLRCVTQPDAERAASAVLRAFQAPVSLSGIDVDVSASFGVALAPRDGTTVSALMKRADLAMYDAKHSGRRLRIFDQTLETSSPSKLALVGELRQAIDNEDLDVHVQPKLDARTGALVGVEALARWTTPERGDVSPAEFVPLAERSGLIRPLTRHVLDTSASACAGWQSALPGVGIAVNVSVRSLVDGELVRMVDRVLRRSRLDPQLLTLEITESHIMADPGNSLEVLHQLRERDVRLSVDDFGTGYSSLSYLRRLPVQEVKIDRSFVRGMTAEPDDAAIVKSIIELARTLGLHVVAEGVEDEETWHALTELGVDDIQGWVIARAMPRHELLPWATARAETRRPAV